MTECSKMKIGFDKRSSEKVVLFMNKYHVRNYAAYLLPASYCSSKTADNRTPDFQGIAA